MSTPSVHPNHKGKGIVCPYETCRKLQEITTLDSAIDHLKDRHSELNVANLWLYYFYYCRECPYIAIQKVNLQAHLRVKHDMPKADIGYHTHGAIDFCVGRDGLPKAWTSFPMPSWVEELYGGHIKLETGEEYGGLVKYYPS